MEHTALSNLVDTSKLALMPINAKKPMTADVRAKFMKILEESFAHMAPQFNHLREERKDKMLEEYRKSVGYPSLRKKYDDLCSKINSLSEERKSMEKSVRKDTGLDITDGRLSYTDTDSPKDIQKKVDDLRDTLNSLSEQDEQVLLRKLQARLLVATTVGEALIILKGVLGNSIIPDIKP